MAETKAADPKQKFVLLALFCSVLGAAIAAYLLKEHLAGGAMLGCSKNGTFDCESVNRSAPDRSVPATLARAPASQSAPRPEAQ